MPKEYLTPEDTEKIENAALYFRDKLMIRLLRRLGCRVSELLGLEEGHIDFSRRLVRIEHEKVRLGLACPQCGKRLAKNASFCPGCGIQVTEYIKKETSVRHLRKVPLDHETIQLIREYIKRGGVSEVNGKRMLFPVSRQYAWRTVCDCAKRAGFQEGLENPENERLHHVSPHKFRDAFAINAIKQRPTLDDARIVQELLGHQKIDTTLKYRKVAQTEMRDFTDDLIRREQKEKHNEQRTAPIQTTRERPRRKSSSHRGKAIHPRPPGPGRGGHRGGNASSLPEGSR